MRSRPRDLDILGGRSIDLLDGPCGASRNLDPTARRVEMGTDENGRGDACNKNRLRYSRIGVLNGGLIKNDEAASLLEEPVAGPPSGGS